MVTLTNSGHFTVPSDPREAIKYVFEKLKKLLIERRSLAERIRDVVKDAKAHGYPTKMVRQAMKLDAMSPEQREKWRDQVNAAAALYGMSGMGALDHDNKDMKLWGFIQKWQYLRTEKKELAALFKDLRERAVEAEVDWPVMSYLVGRLEPKDPEDRKDWVERIDAVAANIGYW